MGRAGQGLHLPAGPQRHGADGAPFAVGHIEPGCRRWSGRWAGQTKQSPPRRGAGEQRPVDDVLPPVAGVGANRPTRVSGIRQIWWQPAMAMYSVSPDDRQVPRAGQRGVQRRAEAARRGRLAALAALARRSSSPRLRPRSILRNRWFSVSATYSVAPCQGHSLRMVELGGAIVAVQSVRRCPHRSRPTFRRRAAATTIRLWLLSAINSRPPASSAKTLPGNRSGEGVFRRPGLGRSPAARGRSRPLCCNRPRPP